MELMETDRALNGNDFTQENIEKLEAAFLEFPQVETPLTHKFAPGVYLREILMPSGSFIIGHEHKTEHFNIVMTGRATVVMNGETHEIVAPCTFVSKPGVRKVLFIHEDMRWATVHPTNETDMDRLRDELIIESPAFESSKTLRDLMNLKLHVEQNYHD